MEVTPASSARAWRPYAGLAALGILLGPVHAWIVPAANDALFRHNLAAEALSSLAAGLLLRAITFRSTQPRNPQRRRAICMLFLPPCLAILLNTHALPFLPSREVGWGASVAITLASPLWLALLAALLPGIAEVPRAVAGAAIAAIGTVFLVLETSAYTVAAADLPALSAAIVLGIFSVWTWIYAAPRLHTESAARSAACLLLLRALVDAVFSVALERTSLHTVVWREALILLGLDAALTAAAMCLWFWLFQRLPLAGFSLHPTAIWTASILGGLVTFGLGNWRMDGATLIALAALALGLRARTADDQPLALELR